MAIEVILPRCMPSRCVPLSFFQNIIESAQLTNWISSLMPFLDPCSLPAPTERKVLQMKFPRAADVQSCWFGVIHFPIFCSQDRLPAGRDLTVLQLRSGNLPTSCTLLFSSLNRREIRDEGGCPSLLLLLLFTPALQECRILNLIFSPSPPLLPPHSCARVKFVTGRGKWWHHPKIVPLPKSLGGLLKWEGKTHAQYLNSTRAEQKSIDNRHPSVLQKGMHPESHTDHSRSCTHERTRSGPNRPAAGHLEGRNFLDWQIWPFGISRLFGLMFWPS